MAQIRTLARRFGEALRCQRCSCARRGGARGGQANCVRVGRPDKCGKPACVRRRTQRRGYGMQSESGRYGRAHAALPHEAGSPQVQECRLSWSPAQDSFVGALPPATQTCCQSSVNLPRTHRGNDRLSASFYRLGPLAERTPLGVSIIDTTMIALGIDRVRPHGESPPECTSCPWLSQNISWVACSGCRRTGAIGRACCDQGTAAAACGAILEAGTRKASLSVAPGGDAPLPRAGTPARDSARQAREPAARKTRFGLAIPSPPAGK